MATEGKQVTDFPKADWANWEDYRARETAWWKKAEDDGRRFIKFGVADGYAIYEVTGERRYTLRHVPYGDEYRIPAAYIRGLTKDDIDTILDNDKRLRSLFGPSKHALR